MSLSSETGIEFSPTFTSRRLAMRQSAEIFTPNGGLIYMDSLGPCIGYVGFDQQRQILFGKHFPIHQQVDQDLILYQKQLHLLSISTHNTAVAGGNLNPDENFPQYYLACQQAKQRIVDLGIKSFMFPAEAPSSVVDYLAVKRVDDSYLTDHYRTY